MRRTRFVAAVGIGRTAYHHDAWTRARSRARMSLRMIGEGENEAPSPSLSTDGSPLRVRRFGNYTLIKKLATGGMAEIWLATQSGIANFRRFVVIKKILSHLSEQESFVKMFLDEARTCAQLTHPNIVQIYDLGRVGGAYFIAMEYIAGENLAALAWRAMKRGAPLAGNYSARIICDASKALHYAHQMRGNDGKPLEIVHRDVSPQNILVTYEGEVKVVDFGIAKAASKSEQTRTGMLKGKFSYMSPEQCMGAQLDQRSDVFALGIVLYEMVTGKRLFKHESELMILEMITRRNVVPPSQVVADLPKPLEAIIMKALEKDLPSRFQSAQEMQIALDEYLRSEAKSTSSNELGTLMRALFADKIEEKRKLVEAASKNEFVYGNAEGEEENTDQKQPPRPGSMRAARQNSQVPGAATPTPIARLNSMAGGARAPSAVGTNSMGRSMPGYPVPPQLTPTGVAQPQMPPQMMQPGMMPGASYAGYSQVMQQPAPANWVARGLIVFALAVIGVAAWIVMFARAPAPVPVKRGQLTITSQPAGARIFVDGKLVTDQSNAPILTPLTVKQLEYGVTYQVRLDLEGHRPAERPVTMSDEANGKEIALSLDALPGEVVVEVRGESPETASIYFGADKIGVGPSLRKSAVAGPINITIDAPGRSCKINPPRLDLRPGKIERVEAECTRVRGPRSPPVVRTDPPPTTPGDPQRPQEPADTQPAKPSSGCVANLSVPNGYLTIETKPYAKIFVNGKEIGETPISRKSLPAGCAELKAVAVDGSKTSTFRVEIQPGLVTVYSHEF